MSLAAAAAGVVAAATYLNGRYQLTRDLKDLLSAKQAARLYAKALKADRISPWYIIEDVCQKHARKRAIWTRERSWTFQEFRDQIVRYAQWLLSEGVRPGDLVALYLQNSADLIMLLFATHCIGAGPAMVNYNLEGKALEHCLAIADSKLLIIDPDPKCQKRTARSNIGIKSFTLDNGLRQKVSALPVQVPDDSLRAGLNGNWPFALVYASGTSGLPKGCPYTIARTWLMSAQFEPLFETKPGKDCWYCPIPLFHATGLIISTYALLGGVGIAIAPRFSLKTFWNDIHDSAATVFVYVGETARYLLAAPTHPLERKHHLRIAFGTGLRPDVWGKLQTRFHIPEIVEFFTSSEGMFALSNWARGKYLSNCVGHHGLLFRALLYRTYVPTRIDPETGDLWRDPRTGFAQRASYEEGGEILVAVPSKEAFGGYWRDPEATNKRFVENVFRKGDLFWRCGDALRRSADGHWFFLDRLGDVFRWKSENVSTTEVAEVLGRFPGVIEANVYGVTVPGHEGRAGCAALHLGTTPDTTFFDRLLRHCQAELPRYAIPVFLRLAQNSSHIHNYKQSKAALRQEGVDPAKAGSIEQASAEDTFLWRSPVTDKYEPFSTSEWQSIEKGESKL